MKQEMAKKQPEWRLSQYNDYIYTYKYTGKPTICSPRIQSWAPESSLKFKIRRNKLDLQVQLWHCGSYRRGKIWRNVLLLPRQTGPAVRISTLIRVGPIPLAPRHMPPLQCSGVLQMYNIEQSWALWHLCTQFWACKYRYLFSDFECARCHFLSTRPPLNDRV